MLPDVTYGILYIILMLLRKHLLSSSKSLPLLIDFSILLNIATFHLSISNQVSVLLLVFFLLLLREVS